MFSMQEEADVDDSLGTSQVDADLVDGSSVEAKRKFDVEGTS